MFACTICDTESLCKLHSPQVKPSFMCRRVKGSRSVPVMSRNQVHKSGKVSYLYICRGFVSLQMGKFSPGYRVTLLSQQRNLVVGLPTAEWFHQLLLDKSSRDGCEDADRVHSDQCLNTTFTFQYFTRSFLEAVLIGSSCAQRQMPIFTLKSWCSTFRRKNTALATAAKHLLNTPSVMWCDVYHLNTVQWLILKGWINEPGLFDL